MMAGAWGKAAVLCAAFAAGGAAGWWVRPSEVRPAPSRAPREKAVRENRVADAGDVASREALRRRIRELERELASRNAAEKAERVEPPDAPPAGAAPQETFEGRMRRHFEEMRRDQPARYAQMTNRMAQFRARHQQAAASRLEVLALVDTSRMTDRERAAHMRLQEIILREQELHALARPDAASEEDRMAAWRELGALRREKEQVEREVRDTLLLHTAREYGVTGADAKNFAETVKTVYEATQSFGPPGGRRGTRPRR